MKNNRKFSRRSLLGMIAATAFVPSNPLGFADPASKHIPVGLELYSVRNDLKKDLMGTVRGVAKMGYQCVEFYAPYYEWTLDYARQVRKELDQLRIHCYSTHNDFNSFSPEGIGKAVDLNHILGTRYVVLADPGDMKSIDDWKRVAEKLNQANDTLKSKGLHAGYHNHDAEWRPVEGQKPIEILAANFDKSIMLQLDVGTCLEAGSDPVAWVRKNPGRIRSMHCKDWAPDKGYKVLFSEGVAPWKKLFAAAESVGGIEYYLIEQEGSRYSEMETAERCLKAYRQLRA
ncbi:MAG TPA: sugar phosphate isomerase/epimerase [Terriglobia bacterium]|nr:sugar phosphate isomerase/epimerase [Terriglobia bacterium]